MDALDRTTAVADPDPVPWRLLQPGHECGHQGQGDQDHWNDEQQPPGPGCPRTPPPLTGARRPCGRRAVGLAERRRRAQFVRSGFAVLLAAVVVPTVDHSCNLLWLLDWVQR